MYKLNDVNFLNFCVDMSYQHHGQPIDPSKMIGARRAPAGEAKRRRGKGRADGSRTSQATQPEQS